jgi:hypothetical protein
MDSGVYEPYIRVEVYGSVVHATIQPMSYVLEPLTATVTVKADENAIDEGRFRLIRGAVINGVPVVINSAWFEIHDSMYFKGTITYVGGMLYSNVSYTAPAGQTYEQIITSIHGASDTLGAPTFEGTAAWKGYQFYPAGKTPTFSPQENLFIMLRQKYLVFATEDGSDDVQSTIFYFSAPQTRTKDYDITDPLGYYNFHAETRKVIWTDESGNIHTKGSATAKIHNLGYLESTATDPFPSSTVDLYKGTHTSKLPIHLKYRTGDYVTFHSSTPYSVTISTRIKVTEVFNSRSTPAWYQIISHLDWWQGGNPGETRPAKPFDTTVEELVTITGPYDITTEEVVYAPLETGAFSAQLSANDTDVQRAFQKLDVHTHAADYAPIAKGVTNGDSHDHNGGDGAQVSFLNLSNLPASVSNTNDIYRCDGCAASGWTGTINGTPSGATVTYTHVSGSKNTLVPQSTTLLGKQRLYNTTRGTYALISNSNGSSTITLTANAPAGWVNGDTITTISPTTGTAGAVKFIDIEITSGEFVGKTMVFVYMYFYDSGAAGTRSILHPFAAFSDPTGQVLDTQRAGGVFHLTTVLKITNNLFSLGWEASGATTDIIGLREIAYFK